MWIDIDTWLYSRIHWETLIHRHSTYDRDWYIDIDSMLIDIDTWSYSTIYWETLMHRQSTYDRDWYIDIDSVLIDIDRYNDVSRSINIFCKTDSKADSAYMSCITIYIDRLYILIDYIYWYIYW